MAPQVICRESGYDCDFMIRSENDDELIDLVRTHARGTHDTDASKSDVRGMRKTA